MCKRERGLSDSRSYKAYLFDSDIQRDIKINEII